jgi:GNAT superfamily N-acetyltransferase
VVKIRKVEPEDVREMCDRILPIEDATAWDLDDEFWGAYLNGALVGWAGLRPSKQWLDAVFLCSAGIERSARGHHIQRRLIRARCGWAKRNGYYYAITYTMVHNPASSRSLIACGFKPYWPSIPWAGDVCYWFKVL